MKTDIIIPVWNQLTLTRKCINSIRKNTLYPYGLIVIDNASNEETKAYLESLKEDENLDLILIRNEENLGFVKAANQGIRQSHAPYVCLLNNDTEVTPGWLQEMVKVAQAKDEIGIVNANSNTLGTPLSQGESPGEFAEKLKGYSGEYTELGWATGFCMLVKRKVVGGVGLFDEIYGMGNFEDADFSKRAHELGFICVCAKAAYVYHHERRSFIKHRKFDKNFQRNREIFYSKWGKQERILYVLTRDNQSYVVKLAQQALSLARAGHIVWIISKGESMNKLNTHSNIYIYVLPEFCFNILSFWRVLKRKKKFNKVYVDDEHYGRALNKFKLFHKAEVTVLNDKFQIPNDK